MNGQYQRHARADRHNNAHHRPRKRRFSLLGTLLKIVGAAALLILLMRYVIVPVLVMLPHWLGGVS